MVLSPKILKNVYLMLLACKPFNDYKSMPPADNIRFVVNSDPDTMGTYLYDEDEAPSHVITISKERCGHLNTVIQTMAHEMIHLKRHKTKAWDQHDDKFRKYAKDIADELGFDPASL
jgi:hypothetical protein